MFEFADPYMLALALVIPALIYLYRRSYGRITGSIRFSDSSLLKGVGGSLRPRLSRGIIYIRSFALLLVVIAMARPRTALEETRIYVEGIDIVLAVDVSTSMRAMDFEREGGRVDRLEVVKMVVEDFVEKRPNDKIGIVAFSGNAYTVCPLTLDHDWLLKNLERVKIGMMEDGTAIGSAITASLNRLKGTETKEKIVILLTDGRNNAGRISPMLAAEAARTLGVRVYTIGAGTRGMAPYPVQDMFGNTTLRPVEVKIDEQLLSRIAEITNGMYFRATDTEQLENIYGEIDKLEKTPIEESGYNVYNELFGLFLLPAAGLVLLEIILANTWLRRLP